MNCSLGSANWYSLDYSANSFLGSNFGSVAVLMADKVGVSSSKAHQA